MKLKFVTDDGKRGGVVREVTLSIKTYDDGSAYLMSDGHLVLCLNTDGTIFRLHRLPDGIGFKLDKQGRIQLSEEEA